MPLFEILELVNASGSEWHFAITLPIATNKFVFT